MTSQKLPSCCMCNDSNPSIASLCIFDSLLQARELFSSAVRDPESVRASRVQDFKVYGLRFRAHKDPGAYLDGRVAV